MRDHPAPLNIESTQFMQVEVTGMDLEGTLDLRGTHRSPTLCCPQTHDANPIPWLQVCDIVQGSGKLGKESDSPATPKMADSHVLCSCVALIKVAEV